MCPNSLLLPLIHFTTLEEFGGTSFTPRFKSLKVVKNYVGCGACICLVTEYDANIVILLLMTMFEVVNPIVQAWAIEIVGSITRFSVSIEEANNIFGVGASMKKSSHVLVVGELFFVQEVICNPCYMCWSFNLVANSWNLIPKC